MQQKVNNVLLFTTGKWCILACMLVLLLANSGCKQLTARMMIRTGYELYQKESYSKACPFFEKALKLMPKDIKLKQSLGFCYMANYKVDDNSKENQAYVEKAATLFKEVIAEEPENSLAEESLISVYLNANRHDAAAIYLQQRLNKKPNDIETIKQIASLYIKAGKRETAFDWYKKWAALNPNTAEPWYSIGSYCWRIAYCEQNRCEDPYLAIEKRQEYIIVGLSALEKAVQIDPKHAESLAYINLLYRTKAKWVDYANIPLAQEDMRLAEEFRQKAMQLLEERTKEREKLQSDQNKTQQSAPDRASPALPNQ